MCCTAWWVWFGITKNSVDLIDPEVIVREEYWREERYRARKVVS